MSSMSRRFSEATLTSKSSYIVTSDGASLAVGKRSLKNVDFARLFQNDLKPQEDDIWNDCHASVPSWLRVNSTLSTSVLDSVEGSLQLQAVET